MIVELDDPKGERASFIERLLYNPGAMATIFIAVIGQALFSILFQVINNERQEAAITMNAKNLESFQDRVNNLQTPLSGHVFKLEEGIIDIRKAHDDITKRIDALDNSGSRALGLISANQQRVMTQIDRLGDRLLMTDRKMGELDAKASNPVTQARIEEILRNETRLEDQQRRIIEALDNLYSQVSKIPPALRNGESPKRGKQ